MTAPIQPADLIATHFRLMPAQAKALAHLGIHTVRDLLYHFPTRYDEAGIEGNTAVLSLGMKVTLTGTFSKLEAKRLWKSRRTATEGKFSDGSGSVRVLWFNQPYIASYVHENEPVRITGVVGGSAGKFYIANPEVTPASHAATGIFASGDESQPGDLFPVYPETAGITSKWMYHALKRLFKEGAHAHLDDPLPADTRTRLHLPDLASALLWMHRPEKRTQAESARKRFAFEEMFALAVARERERAENAVQEAYTIADTHTQIETFLQTLDFRPTAAQQKAIAEVAHDLAQPHPMARLLEGDVGSGKTLVAAAAAYATVTSRPPNRASGTLQVAYMAPTEILAQQHFESFINYFSHLPINIGLLTGSVCKKFPSKSNKESSTKISRAQLLKWVENGEIAILIGTHALIQRSLQFKHLALAIVDEQHRFGTNQRRELAHKHKHEARGQGRDFSDEDCLSRPLGTASSAGRKIAPLAAYATAPHFLSMTATPIPRTLALTIYGNLDLSVVDELPPGRMKVITTLVQPKERAAMYETIRAELVRGRQAYVICPRIEEPDPQKLNALQAKSAKAEAARLKKDVFPEYEIDLLHGAMTPAEKDRAMQDFTAGDTQILVATSVVEVGVNVANATVIVVEGAERFGLSQLHQLRGRVQRSSHQPYCFLVPDNASAFSLKRLRALEKSSDGFALAEADLALRGAGDLYGKQQWGVSDVGMEALKNPKLIATAHAEARTLVQKDPSLKAHPTLANRAAHISAQLHVE